jgi:hypothetical protein
MSKTPLVYIVILNWNGWKDTLACVESCRKLAYDNFHIVIIDNGSVDGSEHILRNALPNIELIQSGSNLGFAGGNNIGIHVALKHTAQYIWLLNNDTTVEIAALKALVEAAEKYPGAGIIGSKIFTYSDSNRLWFAGGFWRVAKLLLKIRGEGEEDRGQYDQLREVDFITGCSLLIRASAVLDIGLLDERYFLYWEDTDWNARAAKHNWQILYAPGSIVRHKVSSSFKRKTYEQAYYYLRNKLLFFERHAPLLLPLVLLFGLLGALRYILQGQTNFTRGYLDGLKDYIRRQFGKRSA